MDDQILRCNNRTATGGICRKELKQIAIVTTCSHVLCKECAESTAFVGIAGKERQCPVCTQPLPNVDDAAQINLRPTEEYKMSVLCGFDPTTIMECASSALSFWNYQMLQETAYQQHLLLALSKKYSHLNDGVNKLVDQANDEIGGLRKKIGDMANDNGKLQQRNIELAETCRERGKKYAELRKGYEVLKKMVQHNQQNLVTEKVAEQAVRTFADNPTPDALDGILMGKSMHMNDNASGKPPFSTMSRGFEHPFHHQRAGSDTQYVQHTSRMPPPPRPMDLYQPSHITMPNQHRTPLIADTFRNANVADRAQHPSIIPAPRSRDGMTTPRAPTSASRYSFKPNISHGANSASRMNSSRRGSHGGITAGMKVGHPSIDSQTSYPPGYVPARVAQSNHITSGSDASQYFSRLQ